MLIVIASFMDLIDDYVDVLFANDFEIQSLFEVRATRTGTELDK